MAVLLDCVFVWKSNRALTCLDSYQAVNRPGRSLVIVLLWDWLSMTMKVQEGVPKHLQFIHRNHFGNDYNATATPNYCADSSLNLISIYAMIGDIS